MLAKAKRRRRRRLGLLPNPSRGDLGPREPERLSNGLIEELIR
jgi:hypothetical protein